MSDMVDLRYVTRRRNQDGAVRIYWNRPGHDLKRLDEQWPDTWPIMVTRLNLQADLGKEATAGADEGTLGWVIEKYRASEDYERLADSTRYMYERWLKQFEADWGSLTPADITRTVVCDLMDKIQSLGVKRQARAVLYNVLSLARNRGLVKENEAADLRLRVPPARKTLWGAENWKKYLEGCAGAVNGTGLFVGAHALLYTGQRPLDTLGMMRSDYDGDLIRVVQQKTGVKLEIPVHRDLKAVLDPHLESSNSLFLISKDDGQPFKRDYFAECSLIVRRKLGMGNLQLRDLRREAVVKLFEVGCTEAECAAITGHSLNEIKNVIETYFVRTTPMARAAIAKWENKSKPGE